MTRLPWYIAWLLWFVKGLGWLAKGIGLACYGFVWVLMKIAGYEDKPK